MGRVLLLMTTTTYRATAFLEAGRRLQVPIVVGSERPQALAAVNPSGHLTLDFAAPDRAVRTVVEFAKATPISAVIAADDDGVILAAMAAAALGLPHNSVEAVGAARNKYQMRQLLAEAGIPGPAFARFAIDDDPADVAGRVHYPCVVKPLALSASRGVIRADNAPQFVTAWQRLVAILHRPEVAALAGRAAQEILVEGFIPGVEVALEGLLTEGQLKVLALFDKPDPLDGPFFEETIYVTPSRLSTAMQEAIVACTACVAAALGLRHGPIHAELRVNERGPWMLEIAPRSIGGLCSRTLRFDSMRSLEELILQHALGVDVTRCEREKPAAGVMMLPIPRAGILRGVLGQEEAKRVPGVEDLRLTIPIGQAVVPVPEGSKYLGFIFAREETPAAVETALRAAHHRLTFVITPAEESGAGAESLPPMASKTDILSFLGH